MKTLKIYFMLLGCLMPSLLFGQSAIKVNSAGDVAINREPVSGWFDIGDPTAIRGSAIVMGDLSVYDDIQDCNNIHVRYNMSGVDKIYSSSTSGDLNIGGSDYTLELTQGQIWDGGSDTWVDKDYSLKIHGDALSVGGNWLTSDEKVKKDVDSINTNEILQKIQKIKGRKYHYKTRGELNQMQNSNQLNFGMDTIDLEWQRKMFERRVNRKLLSMDSTIGNNQNTLNAAHGGLRISEQDTNRFRASDTLLMNRCGFERIITRDNKKYGIRTKAPSLSKETQYGLIAQEIKDEFPELVKYDSTTMLYAINYNGFIPVLLEAVKAQQQQIAGQQQQITQQQQLITALTQEMNTVKTRCCASIVTPFSDTAAKLKSGHSTTGVENNTSQPSPYLAQNQPNPFTDETEIRYYLPTETIQATLYIYDMQGKQVDYYPVTQTGSSSITIEGGTLNPGMYMYTLIADGNEVDTRRMILTK
jgi:hypothetical protein